MSSSYAPRPGSWPFRAIAHLETLPPGTELTLSALAEAIGGNGATLQQFITPALDAGVIERRLKHGQLRPYWYRLAGPMREAEPAAPATEHPAPPRASAAERLRCALWSDGTLQIERHADDIVLLTRDQVRQLVDYLDSISLESARAPAA